MTELLIPIALMVGLPLAAALVGEIIHRIATRKSKHESE